MLQLIHNEIRLQWYEMRQYWFETVTGFALLGGTFIGLFYGIKSITASSAEPTSLDGLVFGFLMWSFATSAYGSISKSVSNDTQRGYLEQLFLSPAGFPTVMMARIIAEMLQTIVFITLLGYATMWLTENWLEMSFFSFYLVMFLGAPSLVGVGFLISGFTLIFKQTGAIHALVMFALMGIVAANGLPFNIISVLPFTPAVSLARSFVLEGQQAEVIDVLIVLANSIGYFVLGLVAFARCDKYARKHNLIGQY
ncbi:ABC transporter permease [Aestuariibacter sp. AA17]|uniref:ABC transporter permease n=1 Tax=Fluctibacter corallii TaxID=2984329 RepID=A0ABT3A8D2_9ALTE|nr:ABC transporter permease [Aestuariibacter sp. AA17]MCV2884870.1 ABC transporter permease [Aestuariibacter sp. AA17]